MNVKYLGKHDTIVKNDHPVKERIMYIFELETKNGAKIGDAKLLIYIRLWRGYRQALSECYSHYVPFFIQEAV